MKNLLIINSSPRAGRSHSRKLTEIFVDGWIKKFPKSSFTFRDLASSNIPHVNETWISAAFKPESERNEDELKALETSKELIHELKSADVIVVGAPMFNWSITSSLKAYIDQVLRVNETWALDPNNRLNPYIGLLKNKTVFLLLARGAVGYENGGYNEHMNFQTPYLRTVFNIIGITNIHEVFVNGEIFDRLAHSVSAQAAALQIQNLIAAEYLMESQFLGT